MLLMPKRGPTIAAFVAFSLLPFATSEAHEARETDRCTESEADSFLQSARAAVRCNRRRLRVGRSVRCRARKPPAKKRIVAHGRRSSDQEEDENERQ